MSSVTLHLDTLDKWASGAGHKEIQTEVAMRAALMMRRYVPVEESTLRASEAANSRYERGELIWNTPYAAKHYYVPMNHTTAGTTDHWDEAFIKADGDALAKYVETLYKD